MNVSYFSGNKLLEAAQIESEPQYDETLDDGYIDYKGQRYYFSETFNSDGLDECIR